MSRADDVIAMLRCPGCGEQDWDLRAKGLDDLPRLEGTLCCGNCGQAFDARDGVLDMVPRIVDDPLSDLRRRLETPAMMRFYEEALRHSLTPLASPLRQEDRRRWLIEHRPEDAPRAIVDFGCGRGADLKVMREACGPEVAVGVDHSRALLTEAAKAARDRGDQDVCFIKADIEDLPFVGGEFGWACCYGVLHRLSRPERSLEAMAATLQNGASFACLTTRRVDGGLLAVGQRLVGAIGRVHLFSPEEIQEMALQAGLEVTAWDAWGPVALWSARRAGSDADGNKSGTTNPPVE